MHLNIFLFLDQKEKQNKLKAPQKVSGFYS